MSEIEVGLDELYVKNAKGYQSSITVLKEFGCRIYRNSAGKHIVQSSNALNDRNITLFMRGFMSKWIGFDYIKGGE